jgi:hypothetical protein
MEHVSNKMVNALTQISERERQFSLYLSHRWSAFKAASTAVYCRIIDALY